MEKGRPIIFYIRAWSDPEKNRLIWFWISGTSDIFSWFQGTGESLSNAQNSKDYVVLIHLNPYLPGDTIYGDILAPSNTSALSAIFICSQ